MRSVYALCVRHWFHSIFVRTLVSIPAFFSLPFLLRRFGNFVPVLFLLRQKHQFSRVKTCAVNLVFYTTDIGKRVGWLRCDYLCSISIGCAIQCARHALERWLTHLFYVFEIAPSTPLLFSCEQPWIRQNVGLYHITTYARVTIIRYAKNVFEYRHYY